MQQIYDDLAWGSLQQSDIAKIFAKLNNPNFVEKPDYTTK